MFDLNHEIAEWKRSLGQSESVMGPDLDELESHLRDQIDHLSLASLSLQEALLVAKHRLGDAGNLPGEFAKVNGSSIFRRRLQWMLLGVLAYLLIFDLSHLASLAGTLGAFGAGFHGYTSGWIGQIVQFLMILIGLFVIVILLKSPVLGRMARSATGSVFIGSIVIVGSLLLLAARMGVPLLTARFVRAEDYGQCALIQHVFTLAYSAVMPMLVVTLLLLFRAHSDKQAMQI